MNPSLIEHALPIFVRQLSALAQWLEKASAFADARRYSPDAFLQARLSPDMLPLVEQIHRSCEVASACAARLSGGEPKPIAQRAQTMADARQYLANVVAELQAMASKLANQQDPATVVLPVPGGEPRTMPTTDYARHLILPNFFFHVTIAYAILRHAGVEVGKKDYLGG